MSDSAISERERNALDAISRLKDYRSSVSHLCADGLDRKIGTLAIDCIRRALRCREWRTYVKTEIDGLKAIGLYPVPTSSLPFGIRLYAGLTNCSCGLSLLHLFEIIRK